MGPSVSFGSVQAFLVTASTAATVPAAATPTAAIPTATKATATAAAPILSGLGFIDRQGTAVNFLTGHGGDCSLCLLVAAHLDKAETFRSAGVTVHDDLG